MLDMENRLVLVAKESQNTLRICGSGRTVVDDVKVHVRRGEIVGLLGPNGAGKTTSFYMIVGLVKPDHGTIRFNGKDITRLPMFKRARLELGAVVWVAPSSLATSS